MPPATTRPWAALAEVSALVNIVPDPTADLEVRHAAGWLHWCRYLVLDPGDDQQDLSTALRLLAPVHQAHARRFEAVPDQVRTYFDDDRLASPHALQVRAARAVDLLQHALRPAATSSWTKPSTCFGRHWTPPHLSTPPAPGWLANLGLALAARFGHTGDLTDLNEVR